MIRVLVIFCLALAFFSSPVQAADGMANHTAAEQAILIDYDTGQVLFEKNADARMPTSSMSKVMTMYMVFEALEDGRLTLDAALPVSEKAWRKQGSKMFIEVGKQVKVEDLIRGVVVQSGNDATIVFAESLAGSEDAFAQAMTQKAKSLGMDNSNFVNASGWPNENHYSTVRDLAILAKAVIREFPEFYKYYTEKEFTYNNIKQMNRNPLLFRNMGADGMKTGHTEDGGYGLIASGVRNGRRVILVLNGMKSTKERAQESARLLEWGLSGFQNIKLFSAGELIENANIVMGDIKELPLTVGRDVVVTIPSVSKQDLKVEVTYKGPLKAPVQIREPVGTLKIDVPLLSTIEHPLIAGADVPKLGFFSGAIAKTKLLITAGSPDS